MTEIDQDLEERLLDGISRVADGVGSGLSPNDAVIKVAKEDQLPAGHIRLIINAYNTGKTAKVRKSGRSPLEKAAEFLVADPEVVINEVFHKNVKTAAELDRESGVSEEYDYAPDWLEKLAKVEPLGELDYDEPIIGTPVNPDSFIRKVDGALSQLKKARDDKYQSLSEAFDKVAASYGSLVTYFRAYGSLPFEEVREHCEAAYGQPAEALFTKLAADCGQMPADKKKKPVVIRRPMKRSETPYKEALACIETAAEHRVVFDDLAEFESKAAAAELELERALHGPDEPLSIDPDLSLIKRLSGQKRANFGVPGAISTGLQFGVGTQAAESIMKKIMPKPDDKVKEEAFMDVTDPSHEAKLRGIRAQASLHSILNSPYFEGENPHHVTDLFNRLTKAYPRLASEPLLLETAMKRLAAQGSADAHELDQLMGLETKIKQRDAVPTGSNQVVGTLSSGGMGDA